VISILEIRQGDRARRNEDGRSEQQARGGAYGAMDEVRHENRRVSSNDAGTHLGHIECAVGRRASVSRESAEKIRRLPMACGSATGRRPVHNVASRFAGNFAYKSAFISRLSHIPVAPLIFDPPRPCFYEFGGNWPFRVAQQRYTSPICSNSASIHGELLRLLQTQSFRHEIVGGSNRV